MRTNLLMLFAVGFCLAVLATPADAGGHCGNRAIIVSGPTIVAGGGARFFAVPTNDVFIPNSGGGNITNLNISERRGFFGGLRSRDVQFQQVGGGGGGAITNLNLRR